jgi:GT2 family glycosyltransferase
VIIPCLGQARELEACLRGFELQSQDVPFETVVVDSAWDESVFEVASRFRRVKLVRSKDRLSAGAARNLGVEHSAAERLAFIDADCVPDERWVSEACASLRRGHRLCGGPVLDLLPNHPIAWADNHLQFADFQAGRPAEEARYFPGCNMVVGLADFIQLGGFEEKYLSGEDVLFSARAQASFPSAMYYNPRLSVRHRGRTRWAELLEHQRVLGYRRSQARLHLDASYRWMSRHALLAGLVMLRRLGYISLRTVQYDLPDLARLALFLPWLLAGLAAWTAGFYEERPLDDREA